MYGEFHNMNDKEFLNWIYERLKYQYKEPEESDYMRKLSNIIDNTKRI